MDLTKDEMVVLTADNEVTTTDEIRVKVISPQPVIETPLSIGGVKAQIESVDSEIVRLQKSVSDLMLKKSVLMTVLNRIEVNTENVILKTIEVNPIAEEIIK